MYDQFFTLIRENPEHSLVALALLIDAAILYLDPGSMSCFFPAEKTDSAPARPRGAFVSTFVFSDFHAEREQVS